LAFRRFNWVSELQDELFSFSETEKPEYSEKEYTPVIYECLLLK
jgi:hypothetical protein